MNIEITDEALKDIHEAWRFVAPDNPEAASQLLYNLEATIELLADSPFIGRPRPDLGNDWRSLVEKPYVIIYRIAEQTGRVFILRVLHGARNQRDLFQQE